MALSTFVWSLNAKGQSPATRSPSPAATFEELYHDIHASLPIVTSSLTLSCDPIGF